MMMPLPTFFETSDKDSKLLVARFGFEGCTIFANSTSFSMTVEEGKTTVTFRKELTLCEVEALEKALKQVIASAKEIKYICETCNKGMVYISEDMSGQGGPSEGSHYCVHCRRVNE